MPLAALVVATDFTSDRLGFMVRKQAKGRVEGKQTIPPELKGPLSQEAARIILEDVTTTGAQRFKQSNE